MKYIYIIFIVISFTLLTGCNSKDDINLPDTQNTQKKKTESLQSEEPSFDNYESYIEYISKKPLFEPYYKTVFAFEEISGGISDVPIEKVKIMYNEMKSTFDYVTISEYPLVYRGYYDGETRFVDGYEDYQTDTESKVNENPMNSVGCDWEGNEILTTSLKTILLGESVFKHFDNSIEEGRNLQTSDFILKASDEPISIVLGNAYRNIYKVGDTISLELISKMMDFEVVGFYKPDISFSMEAGALHSINFDHTIVMPHFIPSYAPSSEAEVFQHAFHISELTSGYIKILEPFQKINEDTYNQTVDIMEKMAKRNGLPNLYKIPYWPVGFVW